MLLLIAKNIPRAVLRLCRCVVVVVVVAASVVTNSVREEMLSFSFLSELFNAAHEADAADGVAECAEICPLDGSGKGGDAMHALSVGGEPMVSR